jgi:16S rRNA (adenine1518-N6/adenine1519-N6)-dimethyltransferase
MDDLARLPPLRETIAAHGLDARKRLGQHFLLDLNLTRRIARAAAPLNQGTVIEVGPGPGGLTRALLLEGAERVVAVELDSRAVAALQELVDAAGGRLQVVQADALKVGLTDLGPAPRRIVANLPLQRLDSPAGALAASGRRNRRHGPDVPEGGRRPAGRPAAQQGLWPARCSPSMSAPSTACSTWPRRLRPPPKVTSSVGGCVPGPQTSGWPI